MFVVTVSICGTPLPSQYYMEKGNFRMLLKQNLSGNELKLPGYLVLKKHSKIK